MGELRDVLVTNELTLRRARAPQLTMQNEALHALARALGDPPWELLQRLVDVSLRLCDAESAGLSVLDQPADGVPTFRWTHMAGKLQSAAGGTGPVDPSPCGYTLRQRAPQLYQQPARCYSYISELTIPVEELLVVPILLGSVGVGTLWIISHSARAIFDMEDVRVLESLAGFAAFAIRALCQDGCVSALDTARALEFVPVPA